MKRIFLLLLCFVMLFSLCACGQSASQKPEANDPTQVGGDGEAAVTIDGTAYSAAEVDYYYHIVFNNLVRNPYAAYIGISANMDRSAAMNETARTAFGVEDENCTWDVYLKEEAINNLKYVDALYKLAQKEGFTFTDAMQKDLDDILESLRTTAEGAGMSEEDYLKVAFGSNATKDIYIKVWKQAAIANAYSDNHQAGLSYSDSDLEAYYTDHSDELDKTVRTIDVRHILFLTDTSSLDKNAATYEADVQAVKDAAKAKADEALQNWKAGEATEESFAAMANELSEDPGSNTKGGLYEKVYPGQMVQPFNDWCFDESRKAGDTGVVETSYGYHVMFFVGDNIPYWKMVAENALRSEGQETWLKDLVKDIAVTEGDGMKNVG